MKALEFIFQDTEIHFLLGNDKDVMVNATEMAKIFNKRTDVFLKTEHAKSFLEQIKLPPYGGSLGIHSEDDLIDFKGRNGIYFHRVLALKFAAWLDPIFEVWVYARIEDVLFGNYRKHWEAHMEQETAKHLMEEAKKRLLVNPTEEDVRAYFTAEESLKFAKSKKHSAIIGQYRLFKGDDK